MRYGFMISLFLFLTYGTARTDERTVTLLPQLSNKFQYEFSSIKGTVLDTLHPPWLGPYGRLNGNSRKEYEATRLSPAYPCSVITILHGVASYKKMVSKACSVFIWSDSAGAPNKVLYKASVTAKADSARTIYLWGYTVTPAVAVSGSFLGWKRRMGYFNANDDN